MPSFLCCNWYMPTKRVDAGNIATPSRLKSKGLPGIADDEEPQSFEFKSDQASCRIA